MSHRFSMVTVVALVLSGAPAAAQAEGLGLAVGDQIRLVAPSVSPKLIEGILVAMGQETLTVAPRGNGGAVQVGRSAIESLEVARGKKSRAAAGAVIGAVAGVLLGALASNPPSSAEGFSISPGAVILCGAVGAATGGLIGSLRKTDRWVPVSGDGLKLSLAPAVHGGAAIAVRVSF